MNIDEAFDLLKSYTKSDSLMKHALCVETAMACYAKKFNEDEEKWRITGLLHDFDYEKYPDEHPVKGAEILKGKGVEDDIITAILGHANYTNVKRETLLAKALFAVDELSGFLYAYALVRPTKNLQDMKVKSLKKKFKDKSFAGGVNRNDIINGAEDLGVDLYDHMMFVAQCLQNSAEKLGLNP